MVPPRQSLPDPSPLQKPFRRSRSRLTFHLKKSKTSILKNSIFLEFSAEADIHTVLRHQKPLKLFKILQLKCPIHYDNI